MRNLTIRNTQLLLSVACMAIISSCGEPFNFDDHHTIKEEVVNEEVVFDFDFATSHEVSVNVDYGVYADQVNVKVLTSEPTSNDNGDYSFESSQIVGAFFLDKEGRYSGTVNVPDGVNSLWLFANSFGLPVLQEVAIGSDNSVSFRIEEEEGETRASAETRAESNEVSEYKVWKVEDNVYSIVKWSSTDYIINPKYKFGGFDDPNRLVTYDTKNVLRNKYANMMKSLKMFLWNGKTSRPSCTTLKNQDKIVENLNTTISTEYEGQTVEDAEISITLVDECAHTCNAFGYFYYPTGQVPASPDEVEHFIIVPNVSMDGICRQPFASSTYEGARYITTDQAKAAFNYEREPHAPKDKVVPVPLFTTVKLLYHDKETDTYTTHFPAGYSIGYFVRCQAYDIGWKSPTVYYDKDKCPEVWDRYSRAEIAPLGKDLSFEYNGKIKDMLSRNVYSIKEWNGGNSKFISMKYDDIIIYGVENSMEEEDGSYDDLLFYVSATPNTVIQETNAVAVPEATSDVVATETIFRGYYCFEDQWPEAGDYDLNDVIIKHTTEFSYTAQNAVTRIVEHFMPIQPPGSAANQNGFAIASLVSASSIGSKYEFSEAEGMRELVDPKHFIVLTNANAAYGRDCTITTEYNVGVVTVNEVVSKTLSSYDPYIIPQFQQADLLRKEIHMCGKDGTKKCDKTGCTDMAHKYYYRVKNAKGALTGKYPWAYSFTSQDFTPIPEGTPISEFYYKFDTWAFNNGGKEKEWYKYHK